MNRAVFLSILRVLLTLVCCVKLSAQGTLRDYQRALATDTLYANKVYNSPSQFHWEGSKLLWYTARTEDGKRYYMVLPHIKEKRVAFNHEKLAKSLSGLIKKEVNPSKLFIKDLEYSDDFSTLTFSTDSLRILTNLENYELKVIGEVEKQNRNWGYWGSRNDEREGDPILSPDKNFVAYIRNSNLYIKNKKTGKEIQLSYDGTKGFYYSSNILWSPDSKKIIAYKIKPGENHKIYFVEANPEKQLEPILRSRNYLKPGDLLDFKSPQLFKVVTKEHIKIPTNLFSDQFSLRNFQWRENSSAFTFEYNQRAHQIYRLLKIDSQTGEISTLIEESSPTFIDYRDIYRYNIKNGKEIIWTSERDGWNHLYLFNGETGALKNQITKGKWLVREVIKVDEENRQIYFTASGFDKNQDPYFLHYFRIDFDGSNLVRYTTENGNHKVTFSPDYKYYIDRYSRIDLPPISILKETETRETVMALEKADISKLLSAGWQMPEPFVAKGRDGETDIWGMIVRPSNFNPDKKYPIIEYIYAGPHDSFVPKDFHSYYRGMSALAELGFIVVKIDGMGTDNRSKAFQDIAWKNLKDAGFPDRILWIKAAAKKYPYMNIEKVGIHGRSAGGQSSAGALIFYSDFYDVAVSSVGCHDNRMDKIWWNEQWMGYPIGPQYEASSNIVHADQLKGDLMLIVGALDDNVDPATTFQFADALISANKNFELVVIPQAGHALRGNYDEHKRKDFFVEHLLNVIPPEWDKI